MTHRPFFHSQFGPVLALALIFQGCSPQPVEPITAATWFPLRVGEVRLEVQLALTPTEMATGLMHRAHLGSDQGMLFVFPQPGPRSFYMLNTLIPLSIGYFTAGGELVEIHDLQPLDPTPVPSRRRDILFALEVNQGWFARRGLTPGARLDLELVRQALEKRRHPTQPAAIRPGQQQSPIPGMRNSLICLRSN